MLVLGFFDAVELQPRIAEVLLQVEGCDLDGLLLVGGQAGEALGEVSEMRNCIMKLSVNVNDV